MCLYSIHQKLDNNSKCIFKELECDTDAEEVKGNTAFPCVYFHYFPFYFCLKLALNNLYLAHFRVWATLFYCPRGKRQCFICWHVAVNISMLQCFDVYFIYFLHIPSTILDWYVLQNVLKGAHVRCMVCNVFIVENGWQFVGVVSCSYIYIYRWYVLLFSPFAHLASQITPTYRIKQGYRE